MKQVSMLTQLKRSKDVLYIFILALVVALVWIGVTVYRAAVKTSVPTNIQKLTLSLSPSIDTDTLRSLSTRATFTKEELANFPINRVILNSDGVAESVVLPSPSPTPVGTASANLSNPVNSSTSATPTPTAAPSTNQ